MPGQLQGSKTPKPETPRKKLKVTLRIFSFFFSRNLGSGPGGVSFEFFSRSFGVSGFWIPVAGRAFRNQRGLSKRGLGPKGAIGPKRALAGELLLFPVGL